MTFLRIVCLCLHTIAIQAVSNSGQFIASDRCDVPYGTELQTLSAQSETACCAVCDQNQNCHSTTYNENHKACKLNAGKTTYHPLNCPHPVKYFELRKSTSRTMLHNDCTDNMDCPMPRSRCNINQCECETKYSYDPGTVSCVGHRATAGKPLRARQRKVCSKYGTTFNSFPRTVQILDREIEVFTATSNEDVENHLSHCVKQTRYICRSVACDIIWFKKCWLNNDTAYTTETSKVDFGVTYQRNCE